MTKPTPYSDEDIKDLKARWAAGDAVDEIAKALNRGVPAMRKKIRALQQKGEIQRRVVTKSDMAAYAEGFDAVPTTTLPLLWDAADKDPDMFRTLLQAYTDQKGSCYLTSGTFRGTSRPHPLVITEAGETKTVLVASILAPVLDTFAYDGLIMLAKAVVATLAMRQ